MRVGDYPDNLPPWRLAVHPNKLAQRRLPWKRGARQCLIDYDDRRPLLRIGPVEVPPGANRNPQGLEETRRDRLELGFRPLARSTLRSALDEIVSHHPGLFSHREKGGARGRSYAGRRAQAIQKILIERGPVPPILITYGGVLGIGHEHAFRGEPNIHSLERLKRSQQQPGGYQ